MNEIERSEDWPEWNEAVVWRRELVEVEIVERRDQVFMRAALVTWVTCALCLLAACAFEWFLLARMAASFWPGGR